MNMDNRLDKKMKKINVWQQQGLNSHPLYPNSMPLPLDQKGQLLESEKNKQVICNQNLNLFSFFHITCPSYKKVIKTSKSCDHTSSHITSSHFSLSCNLPCWSRGRGTDFGSYGRRFQACCHLTLFFVYFLACKAVHAHAQIIKLT